MIASPKASDIQICQLEKEYVYPLVELVYENLIDLKYSDAILKTRFASLLELITIRENIAESSLRADFHEADSSLEKSVKRILDPITKEQFEDIYRPLHRLLHECFLNQNVDSPDDIAKNQALHLRSQLGGVSPEELFEETIQLLGPLKKRLEKLGPGITEDNLKQLVIAAINNAKDKVLIPKVEVSPLLTPARTFIPAAQDPRYIRQQEILEKEKLEELQLKLFQEEEDALAAQALADEDALSSSQESEDVRTRARIGGRRPGL